MSLVNMVFSSIRLSRCLDISEEKELEAFKVLHLNDITMIGNEVAALPNVLFFETTYWRVEDVRLVLNKPDKQHFFMESLVWLINNFFVPKNIALNGYVFGVDQLFGSFACFFVYNNRIFILPDMVSYFEGLHFSDDIYINFNLVSKHMKELIDKSYTT